MNLAEGWPLADSWLDFSWTTYLLGDWILNELSAQWLFCWSILDECFISMTVLEYLLCIFSISTFFKLYESSSLCTITNPPSQQFLTHFFCGLTDSGGNSSCVCCFLVDTLLPPNLEILKINCYSVLNQFISYTLICSNSALNFDAVQ